MADIVVTNSRAVAEDLFDASRELLKRQEAMRIVVGWPPNINAIAARFRISRYTVFAYGDVLYNPSGLEVPPDVLAHESTHRKQQAEMGVEAWWDRYLEDSAFVLEQEIPAYHRQYQAFCSVHRNKGQRVRHLAQLAADLSSAQYGRVVDHRRALELIRGGKR